MAILEYDQQSPLHRSRSDVEVDSRACGHLVQGTVLKLGRSENFLLFQWCFRGARWFFHIENLKGRLGLLERTPSSLLHVYCCYCLSIVTVFPSFWCTLFGLSSLLSFSSAPQGEREKAEHRGTFKAHFFLFQKKLVWGPPFSFSFLDFILNFANDKWLETYLDIYFLL